MGRRDLILGTLLVTVIAVGVYRAGNRRASEGRVTDLPNLSLGDVGLEVDGLVVRVEGTRPIRAFEPNQLLVRFEDADGAARPVEQAEISFTMKMEMGKHRYALIPSSREGWLQAEFVLPACPSGNRRWYGSLTFTAAGRPRAARFQFDLEPRSD